MPSAFILPVRKISFGFLLNVAYFFCGLGWKGLWNEEHLAEHRGSKGKCIHLDVMSVSKKFKLGTRDSCDNDFVKSGQKSIENHL